MTITIKSNPDGVSGAIQVNGVDKVTIGANGISAGSFAPNSIDAAAAALAFSGINQSLSANGYQKLPSGLIIQWMQVLSNATGSKAFTFPIAFPNAVLGIQATHYFGSAVITAAAAPAIGEVSLTGASIAEGDMASGHNFAVYVYGY